MAVRRRRVAASRRVRGRKNASRASSTEHDGRDKNTRRATNATTNLPRGHCHHRPTGLWITKRSFGKPFQQPESRCAYLRLVFIAQGARKISFSDRKIFRQARGQRGKSHDTASDTANGSYGRPASEIYGMSVGSRCY